jgi:hypothetical protein
MDKTGQYYIGNRLAISLFCIAIFLTFLNIFTPLRLSTDGIRYLNILEYLNGSFDKNSYPAHDFLPHGYPWLLFLLGKLHLLGPMSITIVNILAIMLSCYLLTKVLTINNKLLFYSLVLLSFVNVKHFTLPVSDQLFTLLFIASIFLWSKFFSGQWYYILPALLLMAASIYVRTAGIAIVPGILFYTIYGNKEKLSKHRLLTGSALLLLLIAVIIFFIKLSFLETKIDYLKQLDLGLMIKHPLSIIERLLLHFKEFGEVTLNIPYSKLTGVIKINSFDTAQYLLIIIGVVALYLFIKAIINLKLFTYFAFWVFLTYLAMIFLWPFYDTRFLIPIIPVFIYFFFFSLFKFIKPSYVKIIPFLVYILLGTVSLIYSDAISLSNPFFLKHYGFDPQLTNKYQIHFENKNKGYKHPYNINDDDVLFLLDKYDR